MSYIAGMYCNTEAPSPIPLKIFNSIDRMALASTDNCMNLLPWLFKVGPDLYTIAHMHREGPECTINYLLY